MKGKTFICFTLMLTLLLAASGGTAEGGRIVVLPDGNHTVLIPDGMEYQEPAADEGDLRGIYLLVPDLEMLVFEYGAGELSLRELAEVLASAGRIAEVRKIGETEFLVFQDQDDADGASCVGYSYLAGNRMIEISFFCSTQAAMDLTWVIMESFR